MLYFSLLHIGKQMEIGVSLASFQKIFSVVLGTSYHKCFNYLFDAIKKLDGKSELKNNNLTIIVAAN